jgi:hypothetical protein
MTKSSKVLPKERKRRLRGEGKHPMVAARLPQGLIDEVGAWAAHQKTSRSDAIRRLVELGLKAKR